MAYTRWSSSPWYSFWRSDSEPAKEQQVLCLWYHMDLMKDWTYQQLKGMDIPELTIEYAGAPHDHILEAKKIIDMFLEDVDLEFISK